MKRRKEAYKYGNYIIVALIKFKEFILSGFFDDE